MIESVDPAVVDAVCFALDEDPGQYHLDAALDIVQDAIDKPAPEVYETVTARQIEQIHPAVKLFYVPAHLPWAQTELGRFYSFGFVVTDVTLVSGPKRKNAKQAPRAELFDNPKTAYNRARLVAEMLKRGMKYKCPPAEKAHRKTVTKWAKEYLKAHAHEHDGDLWKFGLAALENDDQWTVGLES